MNNRQIQTAKRLMSHRRGPRTSLTVMSIANSMMGGTDTSPGRYHRRLAKSYIKTLNNACVALMRAAPGVDGDIEIYRFLSPRLNEKAVSIASAMINNSIDVKTASKQFNEHSSIVKNAHTMLLKIREIRKQWEAASCHN